jgi:hypothetical protein
MTRREEDHAFLGGCGLGIIIGWMSLAGLLYVLAAYG